MAYGWDGRYKTATSNKLDLKTIHFKRKWNLYHLWKLKRQAYFFQDIYTCKHMKNKLKRHDSVPHGTDTFSQFWIPEVKQNHSVKGNWSPEWLSDKVSIHGYLKNVGLLLPRSFYLTTLFSSGKLQKTSLRWQPLS